MTPVDLSPSSLTLLCHLPPATEPVSFLFCLFFFQDFPFSNISFISNAFVMTCWTILITAALIIPVYVCSWYQCLWEVFFPWELRHPCLFGCQVTVDYVLDVRDVCHGAVDNGKAPGHFCRKVTCSRSAAGLAASPGLALSVVSVFSRPLRCSPFQICLMCVSASSPGSGL